MAKKILMTFYAALIRTAVLPVVLALYIASTVSVTASESLVALVIWLDLIKDPEAFAEKISHN